MTKRKPDLALGHNHYLEYTRWAPEDLPANRKLYGVPKGKPMPTIEKLGALINHRKPDGSECWGHIHFDTLEVRKAMGGNDANYWTVKSWNPLTIEPSILCRLCGDHGFIRGGKWVPA